MVSVEVVSEIGAFSMAWGASGDETGVEIVVIGKEMSFSGFELFYTMTLTELQTWWSCYQI